jgi:hypothetical protein
MNCNQKSPNLSPALSLLIPDSCNYIETKDPAACAWREDSDPGHSSDTSVIIKILSCGTVEEKLFISDDLYIESKSKPHKYKHQRTPKKGFGAAGPKAAAAAPNLESTRRRCTWTTTRKWCCIGGELYKRRSKKFMDTLRMFDVGKRVERPWKIT